MKEPPKMFTGQKNKISSIFLGSARTNGSTIAKRNIENLKQYFIMRMFGLCSGELLWGSDRHWGRTVG